MKNNVDKLIAAGALSLGLMNPALAQTDGAPGPGYVSLAAGVAHYRDACTGADNIFSSALSITSCDDRATSFKLSLGAAINDYVFGEIFFQNFGKAKYGMKSAYASSIGAYMNGYALGGQIGLKASLGPASLFTKFGVADTHLKIAVDADAGGSHASASTSGSGLAPMISAGAAFDATSRVSLFVDYDYYINAGDKHKTGQTDIGYLNGGIAIRF